MSTSYNMVASNGGEKATIIATIENGTATSVTATKLIGRLPEGYTELEWIQSSGTQYIDSGFIPNQDTRVRTKALLSEAGDWPFGVRQAAYQQCYGFLLTSIYQFRTDYNTTQYDFDSSYTVRTEPIIIDKNKNNTIITYMNGSTTSYTASYGTFSAPYSLILLGYNSGGSKSGSNCRIYYLEIYDNGTLIRNFIPAKRDDDAAIGLYDTVNSIFYTNAGTGVFLTGPEVWTQDYSSDFSMYTNTSWLHLLELGHWLITATDHVHTNSDIIFVSDISVYSLTITLPTLPDEYIQLQWIEGDGTPSQGIGTGLYPVSANRIIVKFSAPYMTSSDTTGQFLIVAVGSGRIKIPAYTNTAWQYMSSTDMYTSVNMPRYVDTVKHTINARNATANLDGTNYTLSSGTRITSNTTGELYAYMTGNRNTAIFRLWDSLQMYNVEDTALVMDAYPAKRKADNAVGLYDIVRDIFLDGGAVVAGPEVT